MGDRISIQFKKDNEKSVTLFSHWGGMSLVQTAKEYVQDLKNKIKNRPKNVSMPIDRLEPEIVIIDFIRHLTKDNDMVDSDLYLGTDENDGDNSDNGHHIIKL